MAPASSPLPGTVSFPRGVRAKGSAQRRLQRAAAVILLLLRRLLFVALLSIYMCTHVCTTTTRTLYTLYAYMYMYVCCRLCGQLHTCDILDSTMHSDATTLYSAQRYDDLIK